MLTPMSIERMMLAVVFGVLVAGAVTACQPHAMVSNPEAEMHAGPLTTSRPDAPSLEENPRRGSGSTAHPDGNLWTTARR